MLQTPDQEQLVELAISQGGFITEVEEMRRMVQGVKSVVVVDDEPGSINLCKVLLMNQLNVPESAVFAAVTPNEAKEIVKKLTGKVLLITDIRMYGIGDAGLQLLRHFGNSSQTIKAVVYPIAMSTEFRTDVISELARMNVPLLLKPTIDRWMRLR